MHQLLIRYVKYNQWANERIAEFAGNLSEEQLDMEQKSSFPSIRKTIHHIRDSEIIWLLRLNGVSPDKRPSLYFTGTTRELLQLYQEQSQKLYDYIKTFTTEDLQQVINYKNLEGKEFNEKVFEIVMHCVNHSTFHRGQLVTMLRGAGYTELQTTDLINFIRAGG